MEEPLIMWTKFLNLFKLSPLRQDQPVLYTPPDKFLHGRRHIGHYACTIKGVDYVYLGGRTSYTQQGIIAVDEVIPL